MKGTVIKWKSWGSWQEAEKCLSLSWLPIMQWVRIETSGRKRRRKGNFHNYQNEKTQNKGIGVDQTDWPSRSESAGENTFDEVGEMLNRNWPRVGTFVRLFASPRNVNDSHAHTIHRPHSSYQRKSQHSEFYHRQSIKQECKYLNDHWMIPEG